MRLIILRSYLALNKNLVVSCNSVVINAIKTFVISFVHVVLTLSYHLLALILASNDIVSSG